MMHKHGRFVPLANAAQALVVLAGNSGMINGGRSPNVHWKKTSGG